MCASGWSELEALAAHVGALGVARGASIAVAESCTGGLLGAALTAPAGASAYFLGGALTYSNEEKRRALGVPDELLAREGAVSEAVARSMASSIRERTGASHGVAITGIAGPGGGTPQKPVGTVWVAVACPRGVHAERLMLGDPGRAAVRSRSVEASLIALKRCLEGCP